MLPIIDLRLADYSRVAFNYCLGLSLPIGRTLWFDWQAVMKIGKELHLNLDEYITALLAACFTKAKVQYPILTFYGAIPGRLGLSLCSLEPLDFLHAPEMCTTLPGCVSLRHDFIPQTAAPFLLYEDASLRRLHPVSGPARTAFYVWDFSDCRGNFLKEVDKAFYFRVMNDKSTYYDYGVVPKNPRTSITYLDAAIPVHHVFCQVL